MNYLRLCMAWVTLCLAGLTGTANAEEPKTPVAIFSIYEIELLPPNIQEALKHYIPRTVVPQLTACDTEAKHLEDAAACELARLERTNPGKPLPRVQIVPDGLPLVITSRVGERVCVYQYDLGVAQHCEGGIALDATGFGSRSSDQRFVSVIIQHEYGHFRRLLEGVDLTHNTATVHGNFLEEQWGDFYAGEELRKQVEAGVIPLAEAVAVMECFRQNIGRDNDPSHGNKRQRFAALTAGFEGDNAYMAYVSSHP